MDFDRLCKEILDIESKIRFASREGLTDLLSPEETKRSNVQAMARWALRNSLTPKVGRGRYAMAEYEKIKRITFPLDEHHLLLVTTEVDADHSNIIKEVLIMVK